MQNISQTRFAITVVGADQPGIVAGVTGALYRLGCNIADSSCAMLASEFAMILIISRQDLLTEAQLQQELVPVCNQMGLTLSIRQLSSKERDKREPEGELCQITVYGADQPGIVYHVTRKLADQQINILDLQTKLAGTEQNPVYIMLLEAALPENISVSTVEAMLAGLKDELKVEIGVRLITTVEL